MTKVEVMVGELREQHVGANGVQMEFKELTKLALR